MKITPTIYFGILLSINLIIFFGYVGLLHRTDLIAAGIIVISMFSMPLLFLGMAGYYPKPHNHATIH